MDLQPLRGNAPPVTPPSAPAGGDAGSPNIGRFIIDVGLPQANKMEAEIERLGKITLTSVSERNPEVMAWRALIDSRNLQGGDIVGETADRRKVVDDLLAFLKANGVEQSEIDKALQPVIDDDGTITGYMLKDDQSAVKLSQLISEADNNKHGDSVTNHTRINYLLGVHKAMISFLTKVMEAFSQNLNRAAS